tara:strand:- start:4516 stop:6507 length:1992 start_codon:yes stop_codon:yes gene_type:complete
MKTYINKIMFVCLSAFAFNNSSAQNNNEQYNPSYHYYPGIDPTGLFYYNGLYYNNWGSASSKDFVHWKMTEAGLQRRKMYDPTITVKERDSLRKMNRLGGSGTIVVDEKNTSGLGRNGEPPLVSFWHNDSEPWGNQVIGLAYSNDLAKTWTRHAKFPILDINAREFRDPKVFWHEPTKKWIMVIGWADVPKIKFFSSPNLIDWEFMSDFGPYGAVEGVWECADLFPLPVDNDPNNIKWVLAISVQPLSGQYFIGDFDGTRFTIDQEFAMDLKKGDYRPSGEVLFDFEQGHRNWKMEGTAFIESPSNQALFRQGAVMGKEGAFFANSHHDRAKSTGKLTSPDFTISKDHINFLVGGNHIPKDLSVNLLVDNKVVRSETGNNSGGMQWMGWDVSEFKGKTAKVEIVDNAPNGAILVDHFILSDDLAVIAGREQAFWLDYGPDFFAVRAWNNYAENEERIIWTAWMGSWRYGGTEPVRGNQSIPRKVELRTFPEGVRLVQAPIEELRDLRGKHQTAKGETFEGIWKSKKIRPSKNAYELIVDFENISADDFGLKIGVGEGEQTIIGYNSQREELYVDRRDSGLDDFISLFPQIYKGPLKKRGDHLKLHVFVDNCSVEVFANNGETVISSKIYPDPSNLGIEFFANHGNVTVKELDLWELNKVDLGF